MVDVQRREVRGDKKRGSGANKINFVITWDPMFPDINEALGKFQHILEEDNECRNLSRKDHSGFVQKRP